MDIPDIKHISQIIEKVSVLEKAKSAFWKKEAKRTKTARGEHVSALRELVHIPMDEQSFDELIEKLIERLGNAGATHKPKSLDGLLRAFVRAAVKGEDIPLEFTTKDDEPLSAEECIGGVEVFFRNKIHTGPTSRLQILLDQVIPQFYRGEEIQVIDERGLRTEEGNRLDEIREAIRFELKRRRKWEQNSKTQESKVGELQTNITENHLLRDGWPKQIQLLKDEVDILLYPWWDYLEANGSWGANERGIIEAALKSTKPTKPKYSANVIQELKKIKYKMKIEAKQKQRPTEPVQKIKLQKKEGQVKTDMPDYREFAKIPVLKLIEYGECHTLEFKETLEYDTRRNKQNKNLNKECLKAIAAFLNTDGGILLIGVKDNGKVTGIERDLQYVQRKNLDGFELKLRNLIRDRFDLAPFNQVRIKFEKLETGTICRIVVNPVNRPQVAHLDKEVYIRDGNTTIKLDGRDLTNWTQQRARASDMGNSN